MKHAPDDVEKASHDGDGHFLLLAAGGLEVRAALDGDQGGHKERQAQVPVAGASVRLRKEDALKWTVFI
jgi:hypothetical protein